jgi:predicted DNA-binding transcriptional regulator YafY
MLDAIQSAAFITKNKTKELTYKVLALAGTHQGELLKKTTVFFDTVKHENEHIYYSVDAIDGAIAEGKKLSFCYFDLTIDGTRAYRKNAERYVVNPVGLIFSGGFYYLVSYSDTRKTLTNYRVDRMDKVEIEKADITPADCVKEFDSYKEQNLAFGMYAGTVENIKLYAHNDITRAIFDKFGTQIKLRKADDEHFTVHIQAQISPVFLSWCAMFGNKLKILSPKSVADELVKALKTVIEQY